MEVDGTTNSDLKINMEQMKAEDLFKAAENGDVSLLNNLSKEHLLKALSLRDEDGRSLLHVAVSFGRSEVSCLFYLFIFPILFYFSNWIVIIGLELITKCYYGRVSRFGYFSIYLYLIMLFRIYVFLFIFL